jgi:integrase
MGEAFIDNGYISCRENGLPHGVSSFNLALTKLCARNTLPHLTVHGLRHMYATILLEQGVPLVKISALLGHASVTTTFEYYCDQMDESAKIIGFMNQTFIPDGGEENV